MYPLYNSNMIILKKLPLASFSNSIRLRRHWWPSSWSFPVDYREGDFALHYGLTSLPPDERESMKAKPGLGSSCSNVPSNTDGALH
jgi:hypothetical protein